MSKSVRIRYFAAFRDAAGVAEERVETTAETLEQLFEERVAAHAGLRAEVQAKVAVNDALVAWSDGFSDDDEVLFFPPVAGG
ncbi:MAG: MoaD/ThiS family protein [Xanthomonadales bacterium]|jgi:molybdopterin synthase sulfur carrier subunit|nr:MoaD/ThiS family protein [Xanthomonadales bacterium]